MRASVHILSAAQFICHIYQWDISKIDAVVLHSWLVACRLCISCYVAKLVVSCAVFHIYTVTAVQLSLQ